MWLSSSLLFVPSVEHLHNYPRIIGISLVFCVVTAAIIFKRCGTSKKKVNSPSPVDCGEEINNVNYKREENAEYDEYMESFARKVAKGNGSAHLASHDASRIHTRPPSSRNASSPYVSSLLPSGGGSASASSFASGTSRTTPGSQASSATATSSMSMSGIAKRLFSSSDSLSSPDTFETSSPQSRTPASLMLEAATNPEVLIGCRIFVKGRGQGTVTGTIKKKFHSTTFKVLFDHNYSGNTLTSSNDEELLKLRRRADKTGEEFHILPQYASRR